VLLCRPAAQLSSIVEVTRFELPSFTTELHGLAQWFGLELAKIVVDECLVRRRATVT